MKPIKITIKAFICYAEEQVIDFTKLGENGLYLITGQTGAGKTTIFDAISYALYGQASGSVRNKPEKLRSHFVDNREKTIVDFDFMSNGKKYNIRREIKPQLNRETKEINKLNESVVLTLEDGTMFDRDKEVRAKIEEVVGLDKDQFAQIVMIAQNDFLRFLQSGTEKRVNILRRIFNTGHIKWFQERLKSSKKEAEDNLQLVKRDFETRGVNPYEREVVFKAWQRQIEEEEKQQKEVENIIKKQGENSKKIAAEIAVAESIAKLFNELKKSLHDFNAHIDRKEEIETLRVKRARGEVALYKVKPIADKCYVAQEKNIAAWKELEDAILDAEKAEKELKETTEWLEKLPSIEKVEDEYKAIEKRCIITDENLEKVNDLKKQLDEFIDKEKLLEFMQNEVESLQVDFNLSDKEFKDFYERFIRNQAGLLAKELKAGEPCLVCGSSIHPSPAMITDDSINEKELNRLQEARDNKKEKLDEISLKCATLKSEIKTLKDSFIKAATRVVKNFTVENATTTLNTEIKRLANELESLQKECITREEALKKLKTDFADATKKKNDNSVFSAKAFALVEERKKRAEITKKVLNEVVKEFEAVLVKNNFADELEYKFSIVGEEKLDEITKTINEYDENEKQIKRDIIRLENETKGKQEPNIETLKEKENNIIGIIEKLSNERDNIVSSISKLSNDLKVLTKSAKDFILAEKKLISIKSLCDVANGKLDFETYAQIAYFERVLKAANLRLRTMSQNRYGLVRKSDEGDKRQRMGLEIDVFDSHTTKKRSVDSLSGGESFLASLSLALGLSDVVQQSAGSVHIDAMFIDEGFGSLDIEVLDLSMKTLSDMAGSNRIIGIISHVSELRERIDKRIDVEKTPIGSKIYLTL